MFTIVKVGSTHRPADLRHGPTQGIDPTMNPDSETTTAILDTAEFLVRTGGYSALDPDDIGRLAGVDVGLLQAAFPDRPDLAVAVLRRYTDELLDGLGASDDVSVPASDRLRWLVRTLRRTLGDDGRMCPCGVLTGEAAGLPAPVAVELRRSIDRLAGWIAQVVALGTATAPGPDGRTRALGMVATLHGAMMVARLHRDPTLFDQITAGLIREAMLVAPRSYGNADADRPWPSRVRREEPTCASW